MIVTRHQPTLSPQVHQYQQQQRQHYPGELVEGNYTDEIESDGIDAEVPHVPPFANGDDLKLACRLWHNSCCCCRYCYHHHASSSRGPTDATCAVWRRAFPHCQVTMWQPLHHHPRRWWTMRLSMKLNQPPLQLQLQLLVGGTKWLKTSWMIEIAHHTSPAVDLVRQRQREALSLPPLLLPPMQRLHHSHYLHQHSRHYRCPLLPLELQQAPHPFHEPPQLMRSPPAWQQKYLGPWWRHRLVAWRRRRRSGC